MKNMKGKREVREELKEEIPPRRKMPGMLVMISNGIEAEVRVLPPPDDTELPGPYPGKVPAQEKAHKFNIDLNYVSIPCFKKKCVSLKLIGFFFTETD